MALPALRHAWRVGVKLLVQGGRVVDPSQEIDGDFDLLIEDGWVRQLGSSIQVEEGTDVFDASGLVWTEP